MWQTQSALTKEIGNKHRHFKYMDSHAEETNLDGINRTEKEKSQKRDFSFSLFQLKIGKNCGQRRNQHEIGCIIMWTHYLRSSAQPKMAAPGKHPDMRNLRSTCYHSSPSSLPFLPKM